MSEAASRSSKYIGATRIQVVAGKILTSDEHDMCESMSHSRFVAVVDVVVGKGKGGQC